jgi:hypothetical protein
MMENVLIPNKNQYDPDNPHYVDFAQIERRVMSIEHTDMTPSEAVVFGGANGTFPLRLGNIKADLVGGPYKKKPANFYGIKMAEEIDRDCVISIPTADYCVPDTGRLLAGLYCGISLAQQQIPIWVGCMGGIGRTGLYFATLAKVMARYQKLTKHKVTIDPIKYTRKHFLAHAVETDQQINYIAALDVDAVAQWAVSISGYKPPWYKRIL